MTIRDHLLAIEERHGHLTPEIVLDEARSESSPIHQCFEWSDDSAAEKYRLLQAEGLIRKVKVIVRTPKDEYAQTRQFVLARGGESSKYVRIERAMQDESLAQNVLEQARRELLAFERKYKDLLTINDALASSLSSALNSLRVAA